jgi:LPS-assembly lipoprotein
MSSHKWKMPGIVRNRGLAALMVAGAILGASGCQVRPLYSDGAVNVGGAPTSTQAALSQIAIKPVKTRYGQEVRNHLIFLFGGGNGQPTAGRYSMNLIVTAKHEDVVSSLIDSSDLAPTAGAATLVASYNVTDVESGGVVASGTREVTASYDVPRQSFAALRSARDAENRAARELAQAIQLAVAQQMAGN